MMDASSTDAIFSRRVRLWQTVGFFSGFATFALLAILEPDPIHGGMFLFAVFCGLLFGVFAKMLAWGILTGTRRILVACVIGVSLALALLATALLWPSPAPNPMMRPLAWFKPPSQVVTLIQNVFFWSVVCVLFADLLMIPAWRISIREAERRRNDRGPVCK
jgi:hypothetical protein